MSETLYVPVGLIGAGVIAWITAGVISFVAPNSTLSSDLLKAGTGAMALGGTSYQAALTSARPQARKTTTTRRRKKPPTDQTP